MSSCDHFICPYPWLQLSFEPDERLRVCCYGDSGKDIIQGGKPIFIQDVLNTDSRLNLHFLQLIREKMITGEVPEFCMSCKRLEQQGITSPRQIHLNNYHHLLPSNLSDTSSIQIKILEITLGNVCNLKCRMCTPYYSKPLSEDFKSLGINYSQDDISNIARAWKNLDQLYLLFDSLSDSLSYLNFLGGEPLLHPSHEKILEYLVKCGMADKITLSYNSNMTVLPKRVISFWKYFKAINIDISIDGDPEVNNYIRFPSKISDVEENIERLLQSGFSNLNIMFCTVLQAYNLHNIVQLLEYLQKWENKIPSIPYFIVLNSPKFLRASVIPYQQRLRYVEQIDDWIDNNMAKIKSTKFKEKNIYNLYDLKKKVSVLKHNYQLQDEYFTFVLYTKKMDKLRNQKFFYPLI